MLDNLARQSAPSADWRHRHLGQHGAQSLARGHGTRFIQISFGSWDFHSNLYSQLIPMAAQFDAGLGALLADLKTDGLLNETLIVAQGEFGRTVGPLNRNSGRDHYQQQAVLFAGARIVAL
jgi:uncharacterized protein (DUF1501 family)